MPGIDDLIDKFVKYEAEIWNYACKQNDPCLKENTAKFYELLFNVSYNITLEAMSFRKLAAEQHDIAKKFKNEEKYEEADKRFREEGNLLSKYAKLLMSHSHG